jgi:hypothetical protein
MDSSRYGKSRRPEEGEVLATSALENSPGELKYQMSTSKVPRAYNDEEVKDIEKPVYDSSEGPQVKPKGPNRGHRGNDNPLSGESFGANPLLSHAHLAAAQRKSQQKYHNIQGNFMDEEDSNLESDGEINPSFLK